MKMIDMNIGYDAANDKLEEIVGCENSTECYFVQDASNDDENDILFIWMIWKKS